MKKLTYFITGGTGFIGRRLCSRLRAEGHEVRALIRVPDDEALAMLGIKTLQGDLLQPASYRESLRGIDVVVHLGADPRFKNGKHFEKINHEATAALLKEVQAAAPGLSRFVFISSLAAIDRGRFDACDKLLTEETPAHPSSDYGISKLRAEQSVRTSGLPFTILRPPMVIGPAMRGNSHVSQFTTMVLKRSPVSLFNFRGKMGVVHVDDLIDAIILASREPAAEGKTFFAGSENISLGEIFRCVDGRRGRLWTGFLHPLARFFPFKAKSLVLDAMAVDSSRLRDLGWVPQKNIRETIEEIATIQRSRKKVNHPVQGWTVVTGAASGLGAAFAEELARMGRKLILVDRDNEGLEKILSGEPNVKRYTVDLGNELSLDDFLTQDFWHTERIDELYACAGFGARGHASVLNGTTQAKILAVNASARIRIVRRALTGMIARRFGRIVLVSSSSAFQPLPYMAAYAASNAAVLSFGEALASELKDSGVHVMTVCPQGMKTKFQASAGVRVLPNEKLHEPSEVVKAVFKAADQGRSTVFIGTRSLAMSLMARVLPRAVNVELWKRLMSDLR